MSRETPWHGHCRLHFINDRGITCHQGGCKAPFKLLRAGNGADGRCELPLLHTAGGLVGGDQLSIDVALASGSRSLITSVAAQKVYGSVGRSQLHPEGAWSRQTATMQLEEHSDLEWMPQEMVLYADALFEQQLTVTLPENASFLTAEIVRLGRTAAGETLNQGRWRSHQSVQRIGPSGPRWEQVDRLEIGIDNLQSNHGLAGAPVFGTLVWAAPSGLDPGSMVNLLEDARQDRTGLSGTMRCTRLDQGMLARYAGSSSRDARFWFSRIWARTRTLRGLSGPEIPRVWPLQEQPLAEQAFTTNALATATTTH